MELTIGHLYPAEMNLYGDLGNVLCLSQRAEWRGIGVKLKPIQQKAEIPEDIDLYFFGGGQDNDQLKIYPDLLSPAKARLKIDLLEKNKPILAICGGYQLLGEYFLTGDNQKMPGLQVIPIETVAPGKDMVHRAVGNLVTKLAPDSPIRGHYSGLNTLVGFENHSGRTRFKANAPIQALAEVLIGIGDNEDKFSDGILFKNVVGSYMHGSVLPKNPHLADFLLTRALSAKYQSEVQLKPLNDAEEIAAHQYILRRYHLNESNN